MSQSIAQNSQVTFLLGEDRYVYGGVRSRLNQEFIIKSASYVVKLKDAIVDSGVAMVDDVNKKVYFLFEPETKANYIVEFTVYIGAETRLIRGTVSVV